MYRLTSFEGKGRLVLYRHKIHTEKQKLVIRDFMDRVRVNLAIQKDMKFSKLVQEGKKTGSIQFLASDEPSNGIQTFAIKMNLMNVDNAFAKLEEMSM